MRDASHQNDVENQQHNCNRSEEEEGNRDDDLIDDIDDLESNIRLCYFGLTALNGNVT